MSVYQAAIADIDSRIERLKSARAVLLEISGTPEAGPVRVGAFGRRPLSGTAKIVMDAVAGGAHKLKEIADAAKVKESTARATVLGLEASGRVKREGKGSLTRYIAA